MIDYDHRQALRFLVQDYWTQWTQSQAEELPHWFYTVLDFMEVECKLRFNVVYGYWEEA